MSRVRAPRVPGEALVLDRGVHHHVTDPGDRPVVGVLGVQGDVLEHLRLAASAGAAAILVTRPADLERLDAVVLPGGESTAIGLMLERFELFEPLRESIAGGLPTLGTCAGAILLSSHALLADGRPADQRLLGVLDATARRNAFGRQVASFEGPVEVAGVQGEPFAGVFIRAPWFERVGPDVEILASVGTPVGERVVAVARGDVLAVAFHPELAGDDRLHRLLVERARARRSTSPTR